MMGYMMNSNTKGHMDISGGVRGHSAGEIFPYVIAIKGGEYHLIGGGIKFGVLTATQDAKGHEYLTEHAILMRNGEYTDILR